MAESSDLSADTIGLKLQIGTLSADIGVRSRFTSATDRLAGNFVDIPNWFIEAARARKKAKDESSLAILKAKTATQIKLIETEGEAATMKLAGLSETGTRLLHGFLREEAAKHENRVAVLTEAAEELSREDSSNDHAGREDREKGDSLDDDWLNVFASHAERASSENLRELWGRILAGEIRQPRSFSLSTLRIVSEMDKDIASAFQRILKHRIGEAIWIDSGDPSLARDLFFLEEFGLVLAADGTLGLNMEPAEDGFIYVVNGKHLLRMAREHPAPAGKIPLLTMPDFTSFSVARLSRVATEIASILPAQDTSEPLIRLAQKAGDKMSTIDLCEITADGVVVLEKKLK